MSISLQYKGIEKSEDKQTVTYREVWQGFENQITSLSESFPDIGTKTIGKGVFTSWHKSCMEGPIWQVEMVWEDDSSYEPSGVVTATLTTNNIQMPLETLSGYCACWDHMLITNDIVVNTPALSGIGNYSFNQVSGTIMNTPALSGFRPFLTAKNTLIYGSDNDHVKWVQSLGQIPVDSNTQGQYWRVIIPMKKPGVQYYDKAVFVVNEQKKYKKESLVGPAINKNINKLIKPQHTFNLPQNANNTMWKLDSSSASQQNGLWVVRSTYTYAGDMKGWDLDLYQKGS